MQGKIRTIIAFRKEGWVFWEPAGELDIEQLKVSLAQVEHLVLNNGGKEAKIPILVSLAELTNIPMQARRFGISWIEEAWVGNIAVYGANTFIRYLVNLIIRAAGKSDFKLFKTREDAEAWLRTNQTE